MTITLNIIKLSAWLRSLIRWHLISMGQSFSTEHSNHLSAWHRSLVFLHLFSAGQGFSTEHSKKQILCNIMNHPNNMIFLTLTVSAYKRVYVYIQALGHVLCTATLILNIYIDCTVFTKIDAENQLPTKYFMPRHRLLSFSCC